MNLPDDCHFDIAVQLSDIELCDYALAINSPGVISVLVERLKSYINREKDSYVMLSVMAHGHHAKELNVGVELTGRGTYSEMQELHRLFMINELEQGYLLPNGTFHYLHFDLQSKQTMIELFPEINESTCDPKFDECLFNAYVTRELLLTLNTRQLEFLTTLYKDSDHLNAFKSVLVPTGIKENLLIDINH